MLGLCLGLAWPQLQVHWLIPVLAWAYWRGGLRVFLPLVFLLSFFYSAVSLIAFWQVALPYLLGMSVFLVWKKLFSLPSNIELFALMVFLGLLEFGFANFWTGLPIFTFAGSELGQVFLTAVVGVWVLPVFFKGAGQCWNRMFLQNRLSSGFIFRKKSPGRRRPFGFEEKV